MNFLWAESIKLEQFDLLYEIERTKKRMYVPHLLISSSNLEAIRFRLLQAVSNSHLNEYENKVVKSGLIWFASDTSMALIIFRASLVSEFSLACSKKIFPKLLVIVAMICGDAEFRIRVISEIDWKTVFVAEINKSFFFQSVRTNFACKTFNILDIHDAKKLEIYVVENVLYSLFELM